MYFIVFLWQSQLKSQNRFLPLYNNASTPSRTINMKPLILLRLSTMTYALKRSNFYAEINYGPSANANSVNKRRTRQRSTIWFSKNVTTNIARNFLLLLDDKHFPPHQHHRLHFTFNRHTVRVSYSCSDNMESFLSTHNKYIYVLKKHKDKTKNTKTNNDTKTCNCRKPNECPVSNTCLAKSLVYKAEVSTDKDDAKVYIGVTATTFKEGFRYHTVH